MAPAAAAERDFRLDLFRGIAWWLIFLDHIPSNSVNWFTIRNAGFSDAAEIFVFISGYTAAFVYGRTLRERGPIVAGARILKRAWQVYVAHVFLLVIFMAQIAFVSTSFQNPLYTEEMNVFGFMNEPGLTLLRALLLQFQPTYMDILPMYVVLLIGLAAGIWLLERMPILALSASVILYILVWRFGWNLPSYPSGQWFFNPLAWQLLFFVAAWCALGTEKRLHFILHSNVLVGLAAAFLALSFAVALTWHIPPLANFIPKPVSELIYPIDKTNLHILRLLHILALVLVTVRLVPRDWRGFQSPVFWPAIVCGQHSLEIFCLGVFLSFTGHFILVEISPLLWMQTTVSVAGIAIMVAMASLMRWYRSVEGRRPGPRPPSPGLAGGEAR